MGKTADYELHGLKSDQPFLLEEADKMTKDLLHDLFSVMSSVHRGMPVYGPWFEERIRSILNEFLPNDFCLSGPSQIYDPSIPDVRSRSWDIVVHRMPTTNLPPCASVHSGFPLLPRNKVAAVIDTKTMFGNVADYASKTVSNLRANHTQRQLDFLGPDIKKIILAASSTTKQSTLWDRGQNAGIEVYCLSKTKASKVDDWTDRTWEVEFQLFENGNSPLQMFLNSLSEIMASYKVVKGVNSK
jgi:hypothetical protein